MELISIIVPVYNVERYLEQCIESLVNQTYKNLEIILVNDGSTDSSGSLCEKLAKTDKRIRVIHKNNEGLGFARNTGMEVMNGKYVTFIDSDDYADSNLIELLYTNLKNENADTCIGGFKRVKNSGEVIFKEQYDRVVYSDGEVKNNLLIKMLGSSPEKSDAIRMSVWNVIYSADIIRNSNLKFPSERELISEDIIFDVKYYQGSKRVVVIDSLAYNYRINEESLTRKYKSDRFEKCKILYEELKNQVNKIYDDDMAILRVQRQFFVNIRECIKQENTKISHKNIKEAISNIEYICKDDVIQDIIADYPVKKLNIKQRLFLYLIKYKLSSLLYCLVWLELF